MTDPQDKSAKASTPTVEAPRSPQANGGSVVIDVRGVSKAFGGTRALDDVSFSIQHGRIHALLGGNGSGKSTLIKIMAGVYTADEGELEVNGSTLDAASTTPDWARDVGLHFVHQSVGVFPDLSVAENFALGSSYESLRPLPQIPWRRLNRRAEEILARFDVEVSPRTRMGDLRPAMQTMVVICRALQDRDDEQASRDILVLDEPTVALPADEVELLLEALRQHAARGQTVILVTHRLDEVLAVASDATFLRDGRHLETREVTGMRREELVERIAGIEHPAPEHQQVPKKTGERLRIEHLAAGPLKDFSLTANGGDIIGIAGLLGSGRSSLLRSLFGVHPPRAGTVTLDGEKIALKAPADGMAKGIVYLPENREAEAAFADQPVRLNFSISHVSRYWKLWRLSRGGERRTTKEAVKDFSVATASTESLFSSLSGGNQQKVVLARWMHLEPRLLLLDEPTQGVDVGARAAIHGLIRKAAAEGAVVLVVSSDARELVELCNRVVGINQGVVAGELTGAGIETRRTLDLAYGAETPIDAKAAERGRGGSTDEH
jgi:ribose transport system ATP-binding protein